MIITKNLRSIAVYVTIVAGSAMTSASPLWRADEVKLPESEGNELSVVWTSQIDSYQREGENRVSFLERLDDGSFVGIYNSGAEALVQEGRIVRLSKDGESLWDVSIQPGFNSSAERLAVAPGGKAFVTGTTMVEGLMVPYLASVDNDGTIDFISVVETALQKVASVSVDIAGDDVVMTYFGTEKESGERIIVLEKYDVTGKKTQSLTRSTEEMFAPLRTYCLEGFLMVPFMSSEALAFDLSSMKEVLCEELDGGNFHNGCVSGDALYNLYQNKGGKAEVCQYKVVDGVLTKTWTLETGQNWNSFNMSLFPVNNGNVALYVNRVNETPGMTVISPDGEIVKENKSISYTSWQSGFVHCVGQSSTGDYYMLAQLSSTYKLKMIQIGEELKETKSFSLKDFNEDYTYYYLNSSQIYFDDNRFMIGGSMRPMDFNMSGYTTFFAEIDVDKDNDPQWTYTCSPGMVSDVFPFAPIADADGNSYLYYRSYYDKCFTKFDSQGKSCWDIPLPENIAYVFDPVLMENGNILIGGAGYDGKMTLMCVTPEGESVFSKPGETDGLTEILTITSALDSEGNIIICFAGRDESYACKLFIAKYDRTGECLDKRTLDTPTQGIILSGMFLTSDDEAIVYGQGYDDNWAAYPCVAGIDSDLNLVFVKLCADSTLQGGQYKAGVMHDGKIYMIGGTNSNGFADIYTPKGDFEKNVMFGDGVTTTLIESIVGNPEGGVVMVGERLVNGTSLEGLILSMDSDGSVSVEKTLAEDGTSIYLLCIYTTDDGYLLVGARNPLSGGFQTVAIMMDGELNEIVQATDPAAYINYTFNGAAFVSGRLFVSSVESIGMTNNGFVSCFEIKGQTSIKDLTHSKGNPEAGSAEEYYTLQGIKVSNPTPGLYLRRGNGKCDKVIIM